MRKTSRDPLGIQSDAVGHQFLHFLAPLLASRDPVGHQFSSFWHHVWTCREAAKIIQKRAKTLQECCVYEFGCLSTLVPDWIPTASRLAKSGAKKCKISAQLRPDSIPTASMDRQKPHLRPYFPLPRPPLPPFSFSAHQPCTNPRPRPAPKTAKAVLSQTGARGSTISIYRSIYLSVCLSVCIHTYVISLVTYPRSCVCVQMSSLASANRHANE